MHGGLEWLEVIFAVVVLVPAVLAMALGAFLVYQYRKWRRGKR